MVGPGPGHRPDRQIDVRDRSEIKSLRRRGAVEETARFLSGKHDRGGVGVLLIALGKNPCSDNTGAYCRARSKLPVPILARLTTDVANGCERQVLHPRYTPAVGSAAVALLFHRRAPRPSAAPAGTPAS